MKDEELRLFIAVDLGEAQRAAAIELMENLKKGVAFTPAHPSWVQPEGMHLTLKFMGNVASKRVKKIVRTVEFRLEGTSPFKLRLSGLGFFPNARKPKVLWVGVDEGKKETIELAKTVDRALHSIGFERERRPFHPHLTLARIRALRGVEAMMDVVHSHKKADAGGIGTVDCLTLYQSELRPEGAVYTALHKWPLRTDQTKDSS